MEGKTRIDPAMLVRYPEFTKTFARRFGTSALSVYFLAMVETIGSSLLDIVAYLQKQPDYKEYNNKIVLFNKKITATYNNLKHYYYNYLFPSGLLIATTIPAGPKSTMAFEPSERAKMLMDKLQEEFVEYFEKMGVELQEKLNLHEELSESAEHFLKEGRIYVDLDTLPEKLKAGFKENAEKAYFTIAENIVYNAKDKEKLRTMPIFLRLPKQTDMLGASYFNFGLTQLKGWITSFSEPRDIKLGVLNKCLIDDTHHFFSEKSAEVCKYCGNQAERLAEIEIPVREITLETKEGDRLTLMIHADLWQKPSTFSNQQTFLFFKISGNLLLKRLTKIQYIIVGVNECKEEKPNPKLCGELKAMPTKQLVDLFCESLYPHIAGLMYLKQAAVLTMASMNTQEMLIKVKGEWIPRRGIMNSLMWGREGTAKSTIAEVLTNLLSIQISKGQAGSSSIKGLTAAYDKDIHAIKAGLIPLNDTRVCLIDELDKFNPKELAPLLEPMESKTINVSKAGKQVTFDANTVLFFTGNNKKMITGDVIEQIKNEISRPLIDRFDLILAVRDPVHSTDIIDEFLREDVKKRIDVSLIKNYYEVIRTIKSVKIDSNIFVHLKKKLKSISTKLTARRFYALLRVICAISKLHLRKETTTQDVDDALQYYISFLTTLGTVEEDTLEMLDSPSKKSINEEIIYEAISKMPINTDNLKDIFTNADVDTIIDALSLRGRIRLENGLWTVNA